MDILEEINNIGIHVLWNTDHNFNYTEIKFFRKDRMLLQVLLNKPESYLYTAIEQAILIAVKHLYK